MSFGSRRCFYCCSGSEIKMQRIRLFNSFTTLYCVYVFVSIKLPILKIYGENMAGLNLTNIYKIYPNGTKAVNDFSLDIEDKEFIVLVGPSGCGKSTVLRMIAGLEEISAGELKIDDRVVNDVECKLRDTAMVFQNYALYPHMTVADNMAFPIKMSRPTKEQKAEFRRRVDEKYPPKSSIDKAELAEIKRQYKEGKKVVLTDENKAEISQLIKDAPRIALNILTIL